MHGVFDPLPANPDDPDTFPSNPAPGHNGPETANPDDTITQPILHGPVYGPAVTDGKPNCQAGQFGYPLGEALVPGQHADNPTLGVTNIPKAAGVAPLGKTDLFLEQNGTRIFWDQKNNPNLDGTG
jgi:hypothetical protein